MKAVSCVVDLTSRLKPALPARLMHPAGVTLPMDSPRDADFLVPEIRGAICAGTYSSELIELLPDAIRPGDRVLVIGAGLGILSTLAAKCPGIDRVLVLEADAALVPYLERVHALNGVGWIETLNAAPGCGRRGRIPFFGRRDLRTSSTVPEPAWQTLTIVPLVDLELVVADEEITLIICAAPALRAGLLGVLHAGPVERVAVDGGVNWPESAEWHEIVASLARRGFAVKHAGASVLFGRKRASTPRQQPQVTRTLKTGT